MPCTAKKNGCLYPRQAKWYDSRAENNCFFLLKAARQAFIDFPNEVSVFEFTDSRQIQRQTKYLVRLVATTFPQHGIQLLVLLAVFYGSLAYDTKTRKNQTSKKDGAKKSPKASKYVCCVPCQTVMPTNEPLLTKSGKQRVSNAVF